MQTVITKCTTCGTLLRVRNSKNETIKAIKYPKCGCVLHVPFKVSHHPHSVPSEQKKNNASNYGTTDNAATQLGGVPQGYNDGSTQLGVQLPHQNTPIPGWLVCNGVEYPLKMGQNIVGRKNSTKPTTIMLDVNDSYMSRMHICINVEQVGNSIRATVSNYQNTNDTQVAGLPLRNGEVIVLNNGMTIKMGDTTVVYRSGTK